MSYLDVPAKVLECFVVDQTGEGSWPFDDGTTDPFWEFGQTPRDYRWKLTIDVKSQPHSSHKTRVPRRYDGMDVKVGDYVASTLDGTALRIIRIDSKTDEQIICVAEDVFRYNTFRDASGLGTGLFSVPGEAMIFEINDAGLPVVDPLPPGGVGTNFYPNLMSRFQNLEQVSNFVLELEDHGFEVGQLVSADAATNSFVLTDDDHPYLIGTVSFVNGPDHFTINPVQKIVEDMDALEGDVADILYADPDHAGEVTTAAGTNPVMIKLRDFTPTVIRSTVPNGTTAIGNAFYLNGVTITIAGSSGLVSLATAINATTGQHGVVATVVLKATEAETDNDLVSAIYGEAMLKKPATGTAQAEINGVVVSFTTTTYGQYRYNDASLVTAADMAIDINAANIPHLVASAVGSRLILRQTDGAGISVVNVTPDFNGTPFAGGDSSSGLPFISVSEPGDNYLCMTAIDARAINLADKKGNVLADYGLNSVENGVKAAAIYIEQGIRKASNYVVPDIAGRNALQSILGDQAYVIDKGDGEWGLYLYNGSGWVLISSAEAAKVDSDTYSITVTPADGERVLGRINAGSKVTSITFDVQTPFDGAPTISVGDDSDHNRLATNADVDLGSLGSYVVNPTHVYGGTADITLKVFFSVSGAGTGSVKVTLTYQ